MWSENRHFSERYIFIEKLFISSFVFGVAILFQYDSPNVEGARTFVKQAMEKDFNLRQLHNGTKNIWEAISIF